MVTTEPNFKKNSLKETRENQHLFIMRRHKNQKNTRVTRVAIHLSTRPYDAMYRVREGKSKIKPFYRLFREFLCQFFSPYLFGHRLNHMFEQSLKLLLSIPK